MTWTRAELKSRAKDVLRKNYWTAFVVALVLGIATSGGSNGGNGSGPYTSNSSAGAEWFVNYWWIIAIAVVAMILIKIFAFYALEAGSRKFFLRAAEGDSRMGYLGDFFKKGYTAAIGTLLLRDIFIFLWTLLLIIPGIVKTYAYRMVPYILADNPEIGATRAIELSNEMTKGEKWNIFVLDLSFIGWYLLGILALGVGVLFVMPYDYATNAELYVHLRKEALESGLTSYEELNQEQAETTEF